MKSMWAILPIASLAALLLACQSPGSLATSVTEAVPPTYSPAPLPGDNQQPATKPAPAFAEMTMTPGETPEAMIATVKHHLAQTLGIPVDQIFVSGIQPVVWRDASLGCPKPSVDYVRVETPGFRIVLEAGGQTYTYHTDESRRFVRCHG